MRKLKWIGLEAIQDQAGFWQYYRDWVLLTEEERQKLTFEQILELIAPQDEEEELEAWRDWQTELEIDEYLLEH